MLCDGSLSFECRPARRAQDKLCVEEEECELPADDEFTVAILGDLHLDPRKMDDYYTGRGHFFPILEDAQSRGELCFCSTASAVLLLQYCFCRPNLA